MGENLSRKLHANTDIHTVGLGLNIQVFANALHPLTSTSSNGDDTDICIQAIFTEGQTISRIQILNLIYLGLKTELYFILKLIIQMLQYDVILVRSQMTNGSF